jgi:sugar/nucleoside kinase (ribokinase family)
MDKLDVLSIGTAVIDESCCVNDHFLRDLGRRQGGCWTCSEKKLQTLIQNAGRRPMTSCGGSSANMTRVLANLGARCAFHSSVGNDAHGRMYREQLVRDGVLPSLVEVATHTDHLASFITNKERTFFISRGASKKFLPRTLNPELFNAKIVHLDGYTLRTKGLPEAIIKEAKKRKALVSFDLGNFVLVQKNKARILKLLKSTDILFMNEAECQALFPGKKRKISCRAGCLLQGKRGAYVWNEKDALHQKPCPAYIVDTTGAGDFFVAGILYGVLKGMCLKDSAKLASCLAASCIRKLGISISKKEIEYIREHRTLPRE